MDSDRVSLVALKGFRQAMPDAAQSPASAPCKSSIPRVSAERLWVTAGILLALLCCAYANHFHNAFHFDDMYSVVTNPYIRDIKNIPRFFTDARMHTTYVTNQNYRPLEAASLTLDYWMGHGLDTLWFHISTFLWYLLLLYSMFVFYRSTFNKALLDARNGWVALFAAALYALHPAMAETVNYIMQRGDVYSTLGVVAGLAIYASAPRLRRYGLYLAPPAVAIFAKEPAAIFPAVLFLWSWLFEEENWKKALLRTLPAALLMGALAVFVIRMQPPTFAPGVTSSFNYRITQPAVLLGYFRKFFLPTGFSADTDRAPYTSILAPGALLGFVFVGLLIAAFFWCRHRRATRPIAFGLAWFLIVSLPTSWIGLAEVENDHRMFFPFVGLMMAVCWAMALWLYRRAVPHLAVVSALPVLLIALAWGTHRRNEVWHTEESLWHEVTLNSPRNGRGLMNYGLTQMSAGRYTAALDYFHRAQAFTPNYFALEINLGIAENQIGRAAEAEPHFQRAILLAPLEAQSRYFYGVWLYEHGRTADAIDSLKLAMQDNPTYLEANHELMQIYASQGDRASLQALAQQTLSQFPSDSETQAWIANANKATVLPSMKPEAAALIDKSLALSQAGNFQGSIDAARDALKIQPDLAEAYNNIAAGYASMAQWDQAIAAAQQAIRIKPDFQLARNNLAWAVSQKAKSTHP